MEQRSPGMMPRARPVMELNLNVDEAIVETVDLIRTVRTQLESITGTIGQGLNLTVADVGDDIGKIITHVEAISKNLADSTGQLYHPFWLLLLFLVTFSILLAILFWVIFRTRREMRRMYRRSQTRSPSSSSSSSEGEEDEEDVEDGKGMKRRKKGKRKMRMKMWWPGRGGRGGGEEEESRHRRMGKKDTDTSPTATEETVRQKEQQPLAVANI